MCHMASLPLCCGKGGCQLGSHLPQHPSCFETEKYRISFSKTKSLSSFCLSSWQSARLKVNVFSESSHAFPLLSFPVVNIYQFYFLPLHSLFPHLLLSIVRSLQQMNRDLLLFQIQKIFSSSSSPEIQDLKAKFKHSSSFICWKAATD